MTPHVGSNTAESNRAMALTAGRTVIRILTEGPDAVPNIVDR